MPKEGYRLVNRVFELRTAKDMSQEELGKAVGLSRNSVASTENGKYKPGIEKAIDIAEFFGLPVGEVFFYEPIEQGQAPAGVARCPYPDDAANGERPDDGGLRNQ